jgi:anti-anti-sigma regulatory factor
MILEVSKIVGASDIYLLKVVGALDTYTLDKFRDEGLLLVNTGCCLVLDFSEVDYVGATVLREINRFAERARKGGRWLRIAGVPAVLAKKVGMFFHLYPTIGSAVSVIDPYAKTVVKEE